MKKLFATMIAILAFSFAVFAQTPQGFTYQAVARNSAGQLINNRTLGVRISILRGEMGSPVFTQISTVSTNANGLFTLIVGENDPAFSSINWENGPYWIQSEVDFDGGNNYQLNTKQKIMAVPYANYANIAGRAGFADSAARAAVADSVSDNFHVNETDPHFTAWNYNYNRLNNRPTRLSQFINDLDLISDDDLILSISGDTLFLSGGNYVILPHLGTGNGTIEWDSILNRPTNLSQFVNDLVLSISGDTLFLSGGNYVILPNRGYGSIEWDSVLNHPTNLSEFNNDLGFITEETQGLADVIAINNNANGQIKNLSTPTDPMDAVNKAYADSLADALNDRIDNLAGRVDTLYAWFLAHRDSMNNVIAGINNHINAVENNLQNQLDQANDRIYQLEHPRVKGALNGIFSVSANTRINFSQGNLQYRPRIKTWRFAAHQYDVAGSDNNNVYMQNYCSTWIDLFGYGTSSWDGGAGRFMPYETTTNDSEYTEAVDGNDLTEFYANGDWGFYNPIINGGNQTGMWRTLTYSEWNYLLNLRPNASTLKGMATVESTPGYVILPDTWTCPAGYTFQNTDTSYTINVYSAADWAEMETAGAVFLPAAGSRTGSVTSNIGTIGNYWTASHVNGSTGYSFHIGAGANVMQNTVTYSTGCSVRLVREY